MRLLYLLLVIGLACSCKNKSSVAGIIDIANILETGEEKVYIQDLFSELDYLPLETTDSSLLSGNLRIMADDTYLLFSSPERNVRLFNRETGRFIRNIGHCGQDPQGYGLSNFNDIDFWWDRAQGMIYFRGWHNDFQLYDLEGNYKGRIQLADSARHASSDSYFLINQGQIWGHTNTIVGNEKPSLFYVESQSKNVESISPLNACVIPRSNIAGISVLNIYTFFGCPAMIFDYEGNKRAMLLHNSPSLWLHDNTVRLKQLYNDTIYNVSEQGIQPYMYFHLGKRHVDEAPPFEEESARWKITIDYVLENETYLYFAFRVDGFHCGFYNKKTGKLTVLKGDNKLLDKETGQPVQIRTTAPDGTFIAVLNADECNETIAERLGLGDEDNPVVVMMR